MNTKILFYRAILIFFNLIEFLIMIRILMSFLNINRRNIFTISIYNITEPVLKLGRDFLNLLNINTGFLDFSPFVVVIFMELISNILGRVLF